MTVKFEMLDWAVVAAYFALVFGVALWSRLSARHTGSSQDFFLAGRDVGWFVIGASLFASNIGTEHIIGLAGSAAAGGFPAAQFEILAGVILLILGWLFVPFYIRSGVFTMPEFLERRYSSASRTYFAMISIIGYVLTKISFSIVAGGLVFEALMGIDFWTGAFVVVVATGIYTLWGGLRAVLYTDMIQMFILIGGAVIITVAGLGEIGGWHALREGAGQEAFDLWRPMSDPEFPWTGIIFGAPILGVWYWCTDQFIVQRVLSAHGITDARRGTIFAGFLKQLPLFIFVIPGVIAMVLAKSGKLHLENPDQALPTLIGALLPAGARGIVVAGLLAALMSSLSSVFNSCSTVFTMDIYTKLNPKASDRHLVMMGRFATLALVGLGLLWIPFIKLISGQLFTYLQSIQAYIAPPIAAVFLVGVLWSRANATGAITTLIVGFLLGFARLVAEMNKADLDGWLFTFADANFLHIAILLFLICIAVLVGVSLATAAPDAEKVRNMTVTTIDKSVTFAFDDDTPHKRRQDFVLSGVLLVIVGFIWVYFSA